jgi:hypothetical protein
MQTKSSVNAGCHHGEDMMVVMVIMVMIGKKNSFNISHKQKDTVILIHF